MRKHGQKAREQKQERLELVEALLTRARHRIVVRDDGVVVRVASQKKKVESAIALADDDCPPDDYCECEVCE